MMILPGIFQSGKGFITRWTVAGDAAARTVSLPLTTGHGEAYNCTVDWGDGSALSTVTAFDDADRAHTYASDGTYDLEIRGTCEGWSFGGAGDCTKLICVDDWGSLGAWSGFRYLYGGFWGCTNLDAVADAHIPIVGSGPTTLFALFNVCQFVRVPDGLVASMLNVVDYSYCFGNMTKLQLTANIFYPPGDTATRFLNMAVDFTGCFLRTTFAGAQGIAPDLWNCDYGETITLDVAPAVDWDGGDVITGQSSSAVATVVAKVSSLVYKIKKHFGTFALDEVVGVTGVADKLADQGAANPVFVGKPISAICFGGAGNSLASLTNYADIPADWK